MAKIKRMSSRMVLPGSFWWELLTYRWMTAEPGSLLKAASAVVRVRARNSNAGSSVVDVVFMLAGLGRLGPAYRRCARATPGATYLIFFSSFSPSPIIEH